MSGKIQFVSSIFSSDKLKFAGLHR